MGVLSRVRLLATLWTVARQAPLSMGFPRQEYWSELSFPPLGDVPNPGSETSSPTSPALAGRFFTGATPGKPWDWCVHTNKDLLYSTGYSSQ